MSRKKAKDQEQILSHPIIIRVTESLYKKLEVLRIQSECNCIGEVIRRILTNRKIKIYQKDISMNGPMEQMALIRKELKSIGVNINQITRAFNQDKLAEHRIFYVGKVANLYKEVDAKVDILLELIGKLAEKWLQE